MFINQDNDLNCLMCGKIIVLTVRREYDSRTGKIRDNKKEAVLFDIADDLSYKSYTNYTLKHFKERISQYNEQQFKYSMFHIRM